MNVFRRLALSAVVSAAVGVPVAGQAQSCPTPPGKDVLLFVDNSSSITNAEFDEAQQAIASIAASVLSRPGYRLAVVNWGCEGGRRTTRDGCRVDLATGSAIPGGWSSNPADFAYAGNNSASNRVCRSFGTNFAGSINRNNCGGANFSVNINDDYAQHGLKILEGVLYSGGTTGGNDSYNQPTLGPSTPTQQLMLIHMTDADPNFGRFDGTSIREMPSTETALGFYHYSNRFKNVRNAVIVGVGIDATAANAVNRGEVAAFASRGGAATDYDAAHPTALSTQAFDTGTPRIASYSAAYNDATILSAANTAFNATVPACVILRKQSVGGAREFTFDGGTNGLPIDFSLDTTVANPASSATYLTQFNTDTSIRERVESAANHGYELSSIVCTNGAGANVPVVADTSTGQLTIPGSQIVAGAELTCTFTNTREITPLPTGDRCPLLWGVLRSTPPTGTGYGVLTSIDPATGAATYYPGAITDNDGGDITSLGIDPRTGRLFAVDNDTGQIRTLAPGASSWSSTGVTAAGSANWHRMVMDAVGNLYLQGQDATQLYRYAVALDGSLSAPATVTLTYSGAVPSSGGDLAIGPDGTIYVVAGDEQALYQLSGDLYAGTAATASQIATVPGDPGAAAFVGTTLYLGDSTNTLYAGPVTGPYMTVTNDFPRIGDMASCSAGLPPMLTLRKSWAGAAVNDAVTVSALDLTTGGATGAALDAVADTPSEIDAGTAFAVVHGRSYTLSEVFTTGTASAYDKALTCTGNTGTGAALTYTANDMSGTLTVGDAATDIVCTFTNVREPTLTLAKTWVNAATGDTAALTATGGTGSPALDSTAETANETDTGAAVKMAVGDVITLAETLGGSNTGGYIAGAWNCTGGVLSGNTLTLTDADVGAAIVCMIANTLRQTDLQVVKTASPNPVVSNGVVTYQIVVTNNGPLAADGAVLTDVAGVGQNCTAPSTTATCSATGGATCPSPTVPVSSLLGSGITIPTLPVGGQITIGLQCTVSATGTP